MDDKYQMTAGERKEPVSGSQPDDESPFSPERDERVQRTVSLISAGHHRQAEAEATRLARKCDPTLTIWANEILCHVRPDKVAVLVGIAALSFLMVITLLATVPHGQLVVARELVDAIHDKDIDRARILFTHDGWVSEGRDLFETMAGRHGRCFARSSLGKELNFIRVEFAIGESSVSGSTTSSIKWTGRYLLFSRVSGKWLINAVERRRPRKKSKSKSNSNSKSKPEPASKRKLKSPSNSESKSKSESDHALNGKATD